MQKIINSKELKEAIQVLEFEQIVKLQLLKEQFHLTYESLKPINLIKKTIKDAVTAPNIMENVLGAAIGIASGYLSKKIFIGTSGNLFRKLFGSVLQFGVTSVVTKNPEAIKTVGQYIFQSIFKKRESNNS